MPPEQRILLIRLGGLGDVVFTLPAVHALRAAIPKARLTFLTYQEFTPLLRGFSEVETVLGLDHREYKRLNPKTLFGGTFRLLSILRSSRFRLAVDFQGFGETAFVTWWTGAQERWGSLYKPGRGWAYSRSILRNPESHPIDYNLDLLKKAGGLEVPGISNRFIVPSDSMAQARQLFLEHSLNPERPTLLLQPFTSSMHKNWPLEQYLETARFWRKRGLQILFSGGPQDVHALDSVHRTGFAVVSGATLLVSAGVAQLCTVVVGGDTGFLHLAVALGKRVVMLMVSLEPGACHPFGHPEWAVLPPSGLGVAAIPADQVWSACAQALGQPAT